MNEYEFSSFDGCGRGHAFAGGVGPGVRREIMHAFAEWRRGHRGGWDRGFGRGRERLFEGGDVKIVVLKLLAERPSYGYQLIKTMEERLAGGYSPSAGVIYPTLTMLEEEGLISASMENDKKVYSLTQQGKEFLENNRERVDFLFERIDSVGREVKRGRSPEIMRAFGNLRGAVYARVSRESITQEQIQKIADAINTAAKTIDEL
ncbi:MAG TPA: PadR family transcriptional regulator [Fimbriimonadaceae bacterium]|nr:PadR family transcriptional regulator [Fimbriimonadaceae bacterium]